LRVHVVEQDFQQFLELVFAREALTLEDSADLFPDIFAIHSRDDLPLFGLPH
jgi:hypothetical protein